MEIIVGVPLFKYFKRIKLLSFRALRPGDPGWIYRARVPTPSNKDYVIRPKWKVEEESERKVIQGLKMKRGYVDIYMHIAPFHSQPSDCDCCHCLGFEWSAK